MGAMSTAVASVSSESGHGPTRRDDARPNSVRGDKFTDLYLAPLAAGEHRRRRHAAVDAVGVAPMAEPS
jgi:hypothetical protein